MAGRLGPSGLDAPAVSNLVHALAAAGRADRPLLALLSERARGLPAGHFDAHHMAAVMHGLATLGVADPPLVGAPSVDEAAVWMRFLVGMRRLCG